MQQEQRKAAEAEARLQQQSKLSEERISSLEEKLSELSEVVGNYERLRFQDQQVCDGQQGCRGCCPLGFLSLRGFVNRNLSTGILSQLTVSLPELYLAHVI